MPNSYSTEEDYTPTIPQDSTSHHIEEHPKPSSSQNSEEEEKLIEKPDESLLNVGIGASYTGVAGGIGMFGGGMYVALIASTAFPPLAAGLLIGGVALFALSAVASDYFEGKKKQNAKAYNSQLSNKQNPHRLKEVSKPNSMDLSTTSIEHTAGASKAIGQPPKRADSQKSVAKGTKQSL